MSAHSSGRRCAHARNTVACYSRSISFQATKNEDTSHGVLASRLSFVMSVVVVTSSLLLSSSASSESSPSNPNIWKRFIGWLGLFFGGGLFSFGTCLGSGRGIEHSSSYHSIFIPLYATRDIMHVRAKRELWIEFKAM